MSIQVRMGILICFAILNALGFFVMLYQVLNDIPGWLKYVNLILNPGAATFCAYVAYILWQGIKSV